MQTHTQTLTGPGQIPFIILKVETKTDDGLGLTCTVAARTIIHILTETEL